MTSLTPLFNAIEISFALVVIAAAIDRIRIALEWGVKGNINHLSSAIIAVSLCALQWFFEKPEWNIFMFAGLCLSMRIAFYDASLNLMHREKIDHISNTTSAKTDGVFIRLHIPFWWQRSIGIALLVNFSLIQRFVL
jgi:hypothetical protein